MRARLVVIGVVVAALAVALVAIDRATWDGDDDASPDVSALGEAEQALDHRNGQVHIQDNLWTADRFRYATWVDRDGAVLVGQHRDGRWRTADLGDLPGNPLDAPVVDDGHNVAVLGVDADGVVHVAANMHGDPLRYVRTRAPHDLDRWEAATMSGAAERVTYPRFVALPDGALLFFWREGRAGHGAVLADVLAPGAEAWEHLGTIIDGRPTDENPYLHRVAVDPVTGAIHLMFVWRSGFDVLDNRDLSYARSTDGGRTWETSDGSSLPVPITHGDAEIVLPTPPQGSGLVNDGGVTVDACGRPHGATVMSPDRGRRTIEHVWHDGQRWHRRSLPGDVLHTRPVVVAGADDRIWLVGARHGMLVAVDVSDGSPGRLVELAPVGRGWEASIDTQALHRRGVLDVLVPAGDQPRVASAALGALPEDRDQACEVARWAA